jgi:hypothetical protein
MSGKKQLLLTMQPRDNMSILSNDFKQDPGQTDGRNRHSQLRESPFRD